MNDKKIIIRNCPAFAKGIFCKGGDIIDDGCADKTLDRNTLISCQDCTDCVLKQIIELCKEVNTKFYDSVHQRYLSPSKAKFARQILELLDIEEIE